MAGSAIALLIAGQVQSHHRWLTAAGFAIILGSAVVQLVAPRADWLKIEESLSPAAGILIVGLGDERVTVLTLLWLSAVASGVLARGGRAGGIGRALVLGALALPFARTMHARPEYVAMCLATIALLLTCGRLTQELRTLLLQARFDADHDGLTGALSRSAFRAALTSVAKTARSEAPVALVLLDLDNFGQVNKTHGHAAGDTLLAQVVTRIGELVGVQSPIGRLGGDEFALVTRDPDPAAMARRVLDELEAPIGDAVSVAAAAGVARAPRDGRDADGLLRAADIALRVAKRTGRQQVAVFAGGSLSDEGPDGPRAALGRLIAGDGLSMAVQPIYEVPSGKVHAFEALARFGAGSQDSPLHWFALADELGVRDELELACLRTALALLPQRPAGTLLSVNLSGPVLLDVRAQAMLEALPDLRGLIIEITEETLVENAAALRSAVAPLLARGVRMAIDDLGAGYSGLRQITTVHPTYLKIDRSLIHDLDADSDRAALITALLGYARHTGGHVVAEGVETEAELAALVDLGVPLVQGYHLARPGPPWAGLEAGDHASDGARAAGVAARVAGVAARAAAA